MTANAPDDASRATTFAELGLKPQLLNALTRLGYEEPTPIQREAIPTLLEGTDLLGQAATGTGKTAAFALPVLQRLVGDRRGKAPYALVLVPTRELAVQVSEAMHRYGKDIGARVVPIYGGQPIGRQLQALSRGVDVVVATPGRALDHINRGTLTLDEIEIVVLDEADEMLDMGFAEEIDDILQNAPTERQTVLFSATLPARINGIAKRHLRDARRLQVDQEKVEAGESPRVEQRAYLVSRAHKPAAIGRVLDVESPKAAIVFCRSRDQVDQLTETLNGRGYRAEALHGGMNQEQRDRVMGRLRNETADLLVATDVAARGLDIDHLTHVINYDVPSAPDAYVHRIGRVGRAGREGVAITLTEPREHRMLQSIERVTKQKIAIEKVPTVADARARRIDLTSGALRETMLEADAEHFRVVVESLADEFDLMEIAIAAVKLAHEATGNTIDEAEIPEMATSAKHATRQFDQQGRNRITGGDTRKGRATSGPMSRIFVGAGRSARMRPQDLVGAIANETSLAGRDIGAIQITENFSLVEVPESSVNEVITALRATTVKGKKATIRRDRDPRSK